MIRLAEIHQKYEKIIHSNLSEQEKDKELANLMTKMEREFKIPLLHDPKWEGENKSVISLYRIISETRTSI